MDQFECAGLSHDKAIDAVRRVAHAMARFKEMSPGERNEFATELAKRFVLSKH